MPLGINMKGYSSGAAQRRRRRRLPRRLLRADRAREGAARARRCLHRIFRQNATGAAPGIRLEAAGYLARAHAPYLEDVKRQLDAAGLAGEFTYHGAVDRDGKLAFLQTLDVLSVPATYDEPKGVFLLEAMASGVPVVQPRRGAFTEIVEKTGGGLLVAPDDPAALADGLYALWQDRAMAATLGERGFARRPRALQRRALRRSHAARGRVHRSTAGASRSECLPRVRVSLAFSGRMLNVSHLSKEYPTPRGPLTVLSDVSFSLAPGDAAAIMGPSGSGKSSLLYILGALEPPTSGTVTLDGRIRSSCRRASSRRSAIESVGFVFQDHCLLPQCTVLENVLIPTLVAPTPATATRRGRAQLVEQVGLGRPHRSSARRAVGRRAPARRDRARAGARAAAAAVRRADRQPRSRVGRSTSRRCCSTCTGSSTHPDRRHAQRASSPRGFRSGSSCVDRQLHRV